MGLRIVDVELLDEEKIREIIEEEKDQLDKLGDSEEVSEP